MKANRMADGSAADFNALPALERAKLMTYGTGEAPYPGYVWDWDDPEPRWRPGEGVEDVHAGAVKEDWLAVKDTGVAPVVPGTAGKVYLAVDYEKNIVAAYLSKERAARDIAFVDRASGCGLQLVELEIEG